MSLLDFAVAQVINPRRRFWEWPLTLLLLLSQMQLLFRLLLCKLLMQLKWHACLHHSGRVLCNCS